jgi:hypothetical protein
MVEAGNHLKVRWCLIDSEVVCAMSTRSLGSMSFAVAGTN